MYSSRQRVPKRTLSIFIFLLSAAVFIAGIQELHAAPGGRVLSGQTAPAGRVKTPAASGNEKQKAVLQTWEESLFLDSLPLEGEFVITGVKYVIDGITWPSALDKYLGMSFGMHFKTRRELEDYLVSRLRLLGDNRIFDSSFQIHASPGHSEAGAAEGKPSFSPVPVDIRVQVKDTWTALALPYPKYTKTEGLSLALRVKDYNFLGSMFPLTLSADYSPASTSFEAGLSFQLEPVVRGTGWKIGLNTSLRHSPAEGFLLHDSSASLSAAIPLPALGEDVHVQPKLSWTYTKSERKHRSESSIGIGRSWKRAFPVNLSASAIVGLIAPGSSPAPASREAFESVSTSPVKLFPYLGMAVDAGAAIPLLRLPSRSLLVLKPAARLLGAVDIADGSASESGLDLSLSLGYESVDRPGTLRKGSSFNGTVLWHPRFAPASPDQKADLVFSLETRYFHTFGKTAGLGFRVRAAWDAGLEFWGNANHREDVDFGTLLRGTGDGLYSDLAVIANLDFPVNFAQGRFFNRQGLSAELHLAPFLDAGIVRRTRGSAILIERDGLLSAGLEAVLHPRFAPSYTYRVSAGYDLAAILKGSEPSFDLLEIWAGIGLLY